MAWVGPMRIFGNTAEGELRAPLATYESPLWPSAQRGAGLSMKTEGIRVTVLDDRMSRSICVEGPHAGRLLEILEALDSCRDTMQEEVAKTSRFARLKDIHHQVAGNLLYLRFAFETGDAAGHNMVTAASDRLQGWLLDQYPDLSYVSISGNYCTDKKVSAVNGILGRGKYCVGELQVPRRLVERFLKSTPERIVQLHVRKNLTGTMLAGGIRSANAHFANLLLAFYLATGQDAANIVEGSQGFVHADANEEGLYFSVTLPNLIVGTVGNGKQFPHVQPLLDEMGCLEPRDPGENAKRLAAICTAVTLCGELSLLAAQTNPGELMKAHLELERS